MKRPKISRLSGASNDDVDRESDPPADLDERVTEAIADAVQSNDKTVEIRPTDRSSGRGLSRLLLLVGSALGVVYWLRSRGDPENVIENATRQTADRTKRVSEQAAETIQGRGETVAETIQRGSETVAERVEEGSETAGRAVEEKGERAAETAEEAGETAAEAAEETDDDSMSGSSSSGSSSGSTP